MWNNNPIHEIAMFIGEISTIIGTYLAHTPSYIFSIVTLPLYILFTYGSIFIIRSMDTVIYTYMYPDIWEVCSTWITMFELTLLPIYLALVIYIIIYAVYHYLKLKRMSALLGLGLKTKDISIKKISSISKSYLNKLDLSYISIEGYGIGTILFEKSILHNNHLLYKYNSNYKSFEQKKSIIHAIKNRFKYINNVFKSWIWTTNHKKIGMLYFIFGIFAGFLSIIFSLFIRIQLGTDFSIFNGDYQNYNVVVTLHGVLMLFFVIMPISLGGYGNFFVPLLIGAPDMAFPRLNNFSFWLIPPSGSFLISSGK